MGVDLLDDTSGMWMWQVSGRVEAAFELVEHGDGGECEAECDDQLSGEDMVAAARSHLLSARLESG